jgi:hypothetical protein
LSACASVAIGSKSFLGHLVEFTEGCQCFGTRFEAIFWKAGKGCCAL